MLDRLFGDQAATAKLRESENRYRSIVESQPDPLCRYLPDGTLTFVNEAYCFSLNAMREALLGQPCHLLRNEATRSMLQKAIAALHREKTLFTLEEAYTSAGGRPGWRRWSVQGIFDEQGQLVEVQSIGRDATREKLAEQATAQYTQRLQMLGEATTALLTTSDLETLFHKILDALSHAISNADKAWLHLVQNDSSLKLSGADGRIRPYQFPGSKGYVVRAMRDQRPSLVADGLTDVSYRPGEGRAPDAKPVQSAIVAPLVLKGEAVGALALEATARAAFSDGDLQLLINFADVAAEAIRNTRLTAELNKHALNDPLTGVYSYRGFLEMGKREVERALRFKHPLVALIVDIDHTQQLNETYGRSTGDQLIKGLAVRCLGNVRSVDLVGRYSGDALIVLLLETDSFAAAGAAERLRQHAAEATVMTSCGPLNITVSIGLAKLSAETPDLEALIKRAEAALKRAKEGGRNRVEVG
jgi:diguanylate cyclase (GGDEF)-like protein/PAS domain S-box-containing protein